MPVAMNGCIAPFRTVGSTGVTVMDSSVTVVVGLIVRLRACVAVCAPTSVTCTVNVYVLATVAVPESTPVAESGEKPGGRAPETSVQLYGKAPPAACTPNE